MTFDEYQQLPNKEWWQITDRGYWDAGAASRDAEVAKAFEDGRQAEREECAKVCMQQCSVIEEPHEFERCAEAIRARSTK